MRTPEWPVKAVKNAVFWDATSCGSCQSRGFGGTNRLHHQMERVSELGPSAVKEQHGTTSRKTAFLIVTTVNTQILHSINRLSSVTKTSCVSSEV
jgi:hypothetical protein